MGLLNRGGGAVRGCDSVVFCSCTRWGVGDAAAEVQQGDQLVPQVVVVAQLVFEVASGAGRSTARKAPAKKSSGASRSTARKTPAKKSSGASRSTAKKPSGAATHRPRALDRQAGTRAQARAGQGRHQPHHGDEQGERGRRPAAAQPRARGARARRRAHARSHPGGHGRRRRARADDARRRRAARPGPDQDRPQADRGGPLRHRAAHRQGRGRRRDRRRGQDRAEAGVERGEDRRAHAIADRARREVDRARRAAGVGPTFPILGLRRPDGRPGRRRLDDLTPAELRKVRDYERRHANRKSVLNAVEKKLA